MREVTRQQESTLVRHFTELVSMAYWTMSGAIIVICLPVGASFDSHHSYDQILLIAEIGVAVSVVPMALLDRHVFPAIRDMEAAAAPRLKN
jgi:uncharacterized membrane protein YhfC